MKQLNEYVTQVSNVHPIKLDEYLSTKVKNANVLNNRVFPTTLAFDEVISFLQHKGFEFVLYDAENEDNGFEQLSKLSKKSKSNLFMLPFTIDETRENVEMGDPSWVRFCKAGKLGKNNPAFFCSLSKDGTFARRLYTTYIEIDGYGDDEDFKLDQLDKFREIVNKHFKWDDTTY